MLTPVRPELLSTEAWWGRPALGLCLAVQASLCLAGRCASLYKPRSSATFFPPKPRHAHGPLGLLSVSCQLLAFLYLLLPLLLIHSQGFFVCLGPQP